MSPFDLPSNNNTAGWLTFGATLLALALPVVGIFMWVVLIRKRGSRKRHKHRKQRHRHQNPTLDQTGGLPPLRDPNQPPPGP